MNLKEILKENRNLRILLYVGSGILLINLLINFLRALNHESHFLYFKGGVWKIIYHTVNHPVFIFFEHSWIEIFSAVLIYVLLEARIKRLFDVPENVGPRDHQEILETFLKKEETHKHIRILDTSIYSYMNFPDLFKKAMLEACRIKTMKVEILLLHPDTYAAEQRGNDLSNKTRDMLEKMKEGLGQLYKCVEEVRMQVVDADIRVRLFKATPIMIFTSWDNKANFGLLPPDDFADMKATYLIDLRTDLGKRFTEYFQQIWDDKKNTIDLLEYLFVKLETDKALFKRLYWGGTSEDRERPRYISTSIKQSVIEELFSSQREMVLLHDGKRTIITLKSKLASEAANEYLFAKQQIENTFGNPVDAIDGNFIYELEYFYEKFKIRLSDINRVKNSIDKKGYCFISHKHYDINLDRDTQAFFQSFANCVDKFLTVDSYEKRAIEELKKITNYKNNPRKRLFMEFKCNLNKGNPELIANSNSNVYSAPFFIEYERNFSETITKRNFPTAFKIIQELEQNTPANQDDIMSMNYLVESIESIIKADLMYLLGEDEFIDQVQKYNIYVHILQTEVGTNMSEVAYPTPQGFQKSSSTYQVIHLISRSNITGGVNKLRYKTKNPEDKEDYLLLEASLDSVFFQNEFLLDGKKVDVEHQTTKIELKEGKNYGHRDVLVIEFQKA